MDKSSRYMPSEVEDINREFSFMNGFVKHPNIVRAVDFLHGPQSIYIVSEFCGNQNMAQVLADISPQGGRLSEADALDCFMQLAVVLEHCHSRNIAHRSVSLSHLVLRPCSEGSASYNLKLVDW